MRSGQDTSRTVSEISLPISPQVRKPKQSLEIPLGTHPFMNMPQQQLQRQEDQQKPMKSLHDEMQRIYIHNQLQAMQPRMPKEHDEKEKNKRVRYKEYKCIFPNCSDGLKTKYNCLSHIWDIHLRTKSNDKRPFKQLDVESKEIAKQFCLKYLRFQPGAESQRKRKPYDCPEFIEMTQERKLQTNNDVDEITLQTIGIDKVTMENAKQPMSRTDVINDANYGKFDPRRIQTNNDIVFANGERNGIDTLKQSVNALETKTNAITLNHHSFGSGEERQGNRPLMMFDDDEEEDYDTVDDNNPFEYVAPRVVVGSGNDTMASSNQYTQNQQQMYQMQQRQSPMSNGYHQQNSFETTNDITIQQNQMQQMDTMTQNQQMQQPDYKLQFDPSLVDVHSNSRQQMTSNFNMKQPVSTTESSEPSFYANSENGQYQEVADMSFNKQMLYLSQHQQQEIKELDQLTRSIPITNHLLSMYNDTLKVYTLASSIQRLHVYGEVFAENGFLQRSDKRSKKDIETIKDALETICKLTGKSYKYKNDNEKTRYGFIAQELREIIPEAVTEDEDGMLSIDPLSLLPFIVEALKELDINIKKVSQTVDVIRLSESVKESLATIETIQRNDSTYSLGPSEFVIPMGISCSIISALVAIMGHFPFIWIFLVFAAICYFASHQFARNGKFTSEAITLNFVLLNVLLVCIAASFLMGTVLQVFLGIYLATMLLLWGLGQSIKTSCLNYFIVSFSFSCIICWILFMLQPTFSCNVATPMKQNTILREYLEYESVDEIMFEITSDVPWNCFNPQLKVNGHKMKFIQGNKTTDVVIDPTTVSSDRVEVQMICSSVAYKCNSYYIKPTQRFLDKLPPHQSRLFY